MTTKLPKFSIEILLDQIKCFCIGCTRKFKSKIQFGGRQEQNYARHAGYKLTSRLKVVENFEILRVTFVDSKNESKGRTRVVAQDDIR